VHGQLIVLDTPVADRFVFFTLHAPDPSAEIAYWQNVQVALPGHTGLVGVCDSAMCSDRVRHLPGVSFPVVALGAYGALLNAATMDQAGRVLICGPRGDLLTTVSKQARPENLVNALVGGINETRH